MKLLEMFKQIVSSISMSFIVLSLTLATYPNLNIVYAQDSTFNQDEVLGMHNTLIDPNDCEENAKNEDGSAAVYKPGCEFNETLGDIRDDAESRGKMTLEGAIEQFVMYSFAAATFKSLFFANTARSNADCPMNKNAFATVYTMNAASVLYILGEMKARAAMKKAQEDAIMKLSQFQVKARMDTSDKTIAELAREENQKQLDAYMALAQVYEDKIEGIKKKLQYSTAAEVGYLGALATELLLVQSQKRMCDVGWTTVTTSKTTNQATISAMLAGASATAATVYGATICGAAVGGMGALTATYTQNNIRQEAQAIAATVAENGKFIAKDAIKIPKFFSTIKSTLKGAANLEASGITDVTKGMIDQVTEYTSLAQNEVTNKAEMTSLTTAFSTAAGTCASCPACAGISGTMASDQATRNAPIFCCGGDTLNPNGYAMNLPRTSVMDKRVDIKFKNTLKVVKGLVQGLLKNKESAHMMKPAILNLMEQQFFAHNMQDIKVEPLKKANKLAAFYTQLNDLDNNFSAYLNKIPHIEEDINKILEVKEDRSKLEILIGKLKNQFISKAYASDGPNFMETLGYTVLLGAASMVMAKFIVNTGLVKPKNRMITYGAMAAVNAGMMIFYKSKMNENEKHRRIILDEASRFANSYGIKSTYGENNSELDDVPGQNPGANPDPYIDTRGEIACATPSSGGFNAAPCPAIVPSNPAKVPKFEKGSKADGSLVLNTLPQLLNDTVLGAAQGLEVTDPKKMKGLLKGLNNTRKGITKFINLGVKDYDEEELAQTPKDKKAKKPLSLGAAIDNMRNMFSGNNGVGITPQNTGAPIAPLAETKKKEKEAPVKSAIASIPKVDLPKAAGKFDYDFGRDVASGEEIEMISEADFQKSMKRLDVEKSSISHRSEVSIFKLISNRYLRSYPVLLPLKKEQAN